MARCLARRWLLALLALALAGSLLACDGLPGDSWLGTGSSLTSTSVLDRAETEAAATDRAAATRTARPAQTSLAATLTANPAGGGALTATAQSVLATARARLDLLGGEPPQPTAAPTTTPRPSATLSPSPDLAPRVTQFLAEFSAPVRSTFYSVTATDPTGGVLTYAWTNTNTCGTFAAQNEPIVQWLHPDEAGGCPVEPVHPGTITVVITGAGGQVTCIYTNGSAPGNVAQCGKT